MAFGKLVIGDLVWGTPRFNIEAKAEDSTDA
jgi:hypothetical protein